VVSWLCPQLAVGLGAPESFPEVSAVSRVRFTHQSPTLTPSSRRSPGVRAARLQHQFACSNDRKERGIIAAKIAQIVPKPERVEVTPAEKKRDKLRGILALNVALMFGYLYTLEIGWLY
jgi:hypothetical protein